MSHPHPNASAYRYHNSCNASVPGPENCTLHVRRIYPDGVQELLHGIVSAQASWIIVTNVVICRDAASTCGGSSS